MEKPSSNQESCGGVRPPALTRIAHRRQRPLVSRAAGFVAAVCWLLLASGHTCFAQGAQITSPAGANLTNAVVTFTWTSVTNASQYVLWVGSTPTSCDLHSGVELYSGVQTNLSQTVTLPTDGRPLYTTLWTWNGSWLSSTRNYTAAGLTRMVSPTNGATLTGASVTFSWTSATNATTYGVWVGNAPGTYDLGLWSGTAQSWTKTLPTDGRTIYVTLWTSVSGVWVQQNNYTYTAAVILEARMLSPEDGTTLTCDKIPFTWSSGVGATQYALWVGSAPGTYDIYGQVEYGLSRIVTLPSWAKDGRTLYVTLRSLINGAWLTSSYAYRGPTSSPVKAEMISPTNGTVLTNGNVTLSWNSGVGAVGPSYYYALHVGSSPGAWNLYAACESGLSRVLTLPTDGRALYVRLWSYINSAWQYNDYTYTAATPAKAEMLSPVAGSILTSASVTFNWTSGRCVPYYALRVGTQPGTYNLYSAVEYGLSRTLTLPTNGQPVYIALWSWMNGGWQYNDYTYTAATPAKAEMLSPANKSTLTNATTTFNWNSGRCVSQYGLWVGSSSNSSDLYSGIETNLSRTLTLPTDGRRLHVSLRSLIAGTWRTNSYTYVAASANAKAVMLSPANGTVLTSSSVTFHWSPGTNVTHYALWMGTTPSGFDVYAGMEKGLSRTVTVPIDGRTLYVTLWSWINGAAQSNSYTYTAPGLTGAKTARFLRGEGWDPTYHSFVIPLSQQKGVALDPMGDNTNKCGGLTPWFSRVSRATRWHYDRDSRYWDIEFENPIAAFGSTVRGTPLHVGQGYSFAIYGGWPPAECDDSVADVRIRVYNKTLVEQNPINIFFPRKNDTQGWAQFATNGFSKVINAYGLKTTIRAADENSPDYKFGVSYANNPVFILAHTASAAAKDYYFIVEAKGLAPNAVYQNGTWYHGWMVASWDGSGWDYDSLYTLEFEDLPPWRSTYVYQPQFHGEPLPVDYAGKSLDELLNVSGDVSPVAPSTAYMTYLNTDASPELRRHAALDELVADLKRDPLALAAYVQNEIELTDAIGYNTAGSVYEGSINPPGVNRGALGVLMEKQGSPIEQCSLLVYLLRQAGYRAGYVFPKHNQLKMLDTRMSKMLRMQIKRAVDPWGVLYTTNALLAVNYPWVTAQVPASTGTNLVWVNLFPWIKDTEIVEGLDLYPLMPGGYNSGRQWVRHYLQNDINIVSLSQENDTAGHLFTKFIEKTLAKNHPTNSIADIGVRAFNRRKDYARWEDFPQPFQVDSGNVTVLESLTQTNSIFDTVSVKISNSNGAKFVQTGPMYMVEVHNRKLLTWHERVTSNTHYLKLYLGPFKHYAITTNNYFGGDWRNVKTTNVLLGASDDWLSVQFTYNRQRNLTNRTPGLGFLDFGEMLDITRTMTMRKGDMAAICFNVGRVTPEMTRYHATEYWHYQQTMESQPTNTPTAPESYPGTLLYLKGMEYYRNCSEARSVIQDLHKATTISLNAFGLAKLSPARKADGTLSNGVITLTEANVDMFWNKTAIAGSGTLHGDIPSDHTFVWRDCEELWFTDSSAQEHRIINDFYKYTNSMAAISTVKLLQLAEARKQDNPSATGMVEVTYANVNAVGSTLYQGKTISLWDTNMWSSISAAATASYPYSKYNVAFVTPGPVINQNYKGLGALILGNSTLASLISKNLTNGTQNGGNAGTKFADSVWVGTQPSVVNKLLQPGAGNSFSVSIFPNNPSPSAPTFASGVSTMTSLDNLATYVNNTWAVLDLETLHGLWGSWKTYSGSSATFDWFCGQPQTVSTAMLQAERTGDLRGGWTSWVPGASWVMDPVNPVTGEFYIDATDLHLPGPMPLQIRRNYSSQNLAENEFSYGWQINCEPYLMVNSNMTVIYATEMDGSVVAYGKQGTNSLWQPTPGLNPMLNNSSQAGLANMFNARLVSSNVSGVTTYYLTGPDKSVRIFPTMTFSNSTQLVIRRPFLSEWKDNRGNKYTFSYGIAKEFPDFGKLVRIESSNGNFIGFDYDVFGHITQAFTRDGRRVWYDYDGYGDLANVQKKASAGGPVISQTDLAYGVAGSGTFISYGLLTRETRKGLSCSSADAVSEWTYDASGFPASLVRRSGAGGTLLLQQTFFYDLRGNLIEMKDTTNNRMFTYDYDAMGNRIAQEVRSLSGALVSWQFDFYNGNNELEWHDGPRYNPEDYLWRKYDGAGHVKEEIRWRSQANAAGSGVQAGSGDNLYAVTKFEHDAFGNQTRAADSRGNRAEMTYDDIGQMKARRFYDAAGAALASESFAYEPGGLVTNHVNVMGSVTRKAYTSRGQLCWQQNPDGTTQSWRYDWLGRTTLETLANGKTWTTTYNDASRTVTRTFSGTNPSASESSVFDGRGNLVQQTDVVGATFSRNYDGLDRVTAETGPSATAYSAQQTASYTYNGRTTTASKGGVQTVTTVDELDRPVSVVTGSGAARTGYSYSADHHSVATTAGTGGNAITTTAWTDTFGKTVLARHGDGGYAVNVYDWVGNPTAARDEAGNWTYSAYDGFNRLKSLTLPDGKQVAFTYDAAGNPLSRTMPGGLTWTAHYDSAGRMDWQQSDGPGSPSHRLDYTYNAFGRINTATEQRGVTHTYNSYDDLMRVASISSGDLSRSFGRDARGLLTKVVQTSSLMAPTSVQRSYDGYGQLLTENVLTNGVPFSQLKQTWDSAGRRTGLSGQPASRMDRTFGYDAASRLASVTENGRTCSYTYADNDLLNQRRNPWRTMTVASRDAAGRETARRTAVNAVTVLNESSLVWRPDSRLANYQAAKLGAPVGADNRGFGYNNRGQLVSEGYAPAGGSADTLGYAFDSGGLGVRKSVTTNSSVAIWGLSNAETAWPAGTETSQQGTRYNYPAYGTAAGASSIVATLDGNTVSDVYFDRNDPLGYWVAFLTLTADTNHTLAARPLPSGTSATNNFGMLGVQLNITTVFNGSGYATNRTFASTGGTQRQALTWDGAGRLVRVSQRDASTSNGYDWTALYDGLGRRLRTVYTPVQNNTNCTYLSLTQESWYDPQVEFLEIGASLNGQKHWKLYGPDLNGVYGGLQGIGGLEAIIRQSDGAVTPLLSDAFGNAVASLSGTNVTWNATRVGGYGPLPNYSARWWSTNTTLAASTVWRGRRMDPTGYVDMGARPYDFVGARFLSPDPLGHDASMDLYSYANGDPVNFMDPDGRFGKGAGKGAFLGDYAEHESTASTVGGFVAQLGVGLVPYAGQAADARDWSAAANEIRSRGWNWRTGVGITVATVAWVPLFGDAIKGVVKPFLKAADDSPVQRLMPAAKSIPEAERLVIGRGADLAKPGALGPGEFKLSWPPTATVKSEWKVNSGLLRQEMGNLRPIRDAFVDDVGGMYLNAERYLLRDRGWQFDSGSSLWMSPEP